MNDDVERILGELTPRGAPTELRQRVLDAANEELVAVSPLRWDRCCGVAVAASLLLGIGMHVWLVQAEQTRQARLFGPPAVPEDIVEIAEAVRSVTDSRTSRWISRQLAAGRPRSVPRAEAICSYRQAIIDPEIPERALHHAQTEENPEMDRDRRGSGDRDTSYHQCRPRLDVRCTA